MNPWIVVLIAGLMETGWALGLKYSEGVTRLWPSVVTVVLALGSFWLLSLTLRMIPVGLAYAIWSGLGIVLISLIGWRVFGQALDLPAMIGLALIIAGVMVVNLFSKSMPH